MRKYALLILLFAGHQILQGQTPGQIQGTRLDVLDPNMDNYVSGTTSGFSADGYDVDEFELKMKPIPFIDDGEVRETNPPCNRREIVPDGQDGGVYVYYDNTNLIVRFRVATNSGGNKDSYTLFIDTDNKVGGDDNNSLGLNRGFEYAITLAPDLKGGQNPQELKLFSIDGLEDCPNPLKEYDLTTNVQVSVAGSSNCNGVDYFYDFFVPTADLSGINTSSELRFVAISSNQTCPLTLNSIADVFGADDQSYNDQAQLMVELADAQCPISISELCLSCDGFLTGRTPFPQITKPVSVNSTEVKGTSVGSDSIFLYVYNSVDALKERDSVKASNGQWTVSGLANLNNGDSVLVYALLEDYCRSEIDPNGANYANLSDNAAPAISDENAAISFTENQEREPFFDDLSILDDGDTLTGATLSFTQNYKKGEDTLIVGNTASGVTISWNDDTGVLTFSGTLKINEYVTLLSSVGYYNPLDTPTTSVRKVALRVNDGVNQTQNFTKDIFITAVNDDPYFIDDDGKKQDTVRLFVTVNDTLEITNKVFDIEDDSYKITYGSLVNGFGTVTQDASDQLKLYFVSKKDQLGSDFFNISACDSIDDSVCGSKAVILNIVSPNLPADITAPISSGDTIQFSMYPNASFSQVYAFKDPNGDSTYISSLTSLTTGQSATVEILTDSTLKVSYNAPATTGAALFELELCDNGKPEKVCKKYYLQAFTKNRNTAPQFFEDGVRVDTAFYTIVENSVLTDTIDLVDPEGDGVSVESFDGTGNPSISANQLIFTVVPPELSFGEYRASISVCDSNDSIQCATLNILLDITPTNEPPVANLDEIIIDNADPVLIYPLINDVDPENEGLKIDTTFLLSIDNGSLSYQGDSAILYTPARYYDGEEQFEYRICDLGTPEECDDGFVRFAISIPMEDLQIYDAFSPNGDGINDVWVIDGIGEYPNNQVRIFDQWNRLVFEVENYDNDEVVWKGQDNSDVSLPDGTYFFVLRGEGLAAKSGTVILKR